MENENKDEETWDAVSSKSLDELQKKTKEVFSNIGTGKSRERLVFDMLESMKTQNSSKFTWLLLRTLNSYIDKQEVKELLAMTEKARIQDTSKENFEKIAYTLIIGIMSAKDNKGGE